MAKLILTGKKEMMLKEILECCLSDLQMEIADRDNKSYREEIKEEEAFLKDIFHVIKT